MDSFNGECAPEDTENSWSKIDWRRCKESVGRLQARIVKATQEGRFNKVKSLQRILVNSFAAKALAVKQVTENKGRRTAGVDGIFWSTPQLKFKAIQILTKHGYKASPLKRVYIPKANGKERPLGIPTMKDRAMQALYLMALEPVAETTADHDSYGFRKYRSTHDAIQQCHVTLSMKTAGQWIFEADIEGCFDQINHDWLMQHILMDKGILQQWLKSGFISKKKKVFPTESGTPQGGVISPTLMNMTLDGLEKLIKGLTRDKSRKWAWTTERRTYPIRYADDFIVVAQDKQILEDKIKPAVEGFLKERGLSLSKEKTRITHIAEGIDFLGVNMRKYKGKLLMKPTKKNIGIFLDKIKTITKRRRSDKMVLLIQRLNPVIRGWTKYYQGIAAAEVFAKMEHEIWAKLWRWARRRHPKKNAQWVKDKYFRTIRNRKWVFGCMTNEQRWVELYRATQTRIIRHWKIKKESNPFDPKWKEYFEKRTFLLKKIGDQISGLIAKPEHQYTLFNRGETGLGDTRLIEA